MWVMVGVRVREAALAGRRKSIFHGTVPESAQLSRRKVLSPLPASQGSQTATPKHPTTMPERAIPLVLLPVWLGGPEWGEVQVISQ